MHYWQGHEDAHHWENINLKPCFEALKKTSTVFIKEREIYTTIH